METLMPAGNLQHIDLAVRAQVDAVYGGFKNWNARYNADNFSKEEYNAAIKICRKHGISFYLTLNVLLLDHEIEEILCVLDNVELPDAFIVTDIGLITTLKEKYPNIPLHLSTQFGTHCFEDIDAAVKLGISRVVLARELTLSEIIRIKHYIDNNRLDMELEVFAWGSQCFSFSGLCFWGTLINTGGGNRGKCNTICRDLYCANSAIGNLFYIPDLNYLSCIDKLNGIVDTIKLEGRRRNISDIKLALDTIKSDNRPSCINGFLCGLYTEDNNSHPTINRRLYRHKNLLDIDVDKYDVIVEFDGENPIKYAEMQENCSAENLYYTFSVLNNPFIVDQWNVSIEFIITDNYINSAIYTNQFGENITLSAPNEHLEEFDRFDVEKIYNTLNTQSVVNIYRIKYRKNNKKQIYINPKITEQLIKILSTLEYDNYKSANDYIPPFNKVFFELDNLDIIVNLLNEHQNINIIYNIKSRDNLNNIGEIRKILKNRVIYKLTLFNYNSESEYYESLLELQGCKVMFTRVYQLLVGKNIHFSEKYMDYTIYCWNNKTLEFLDRFNIDVFTASPELSYEYNNQIFAGQKVQYIWLGHVPLAHSRMCYKTLFACNECSSISKHFYNTDKSLQFFIRCYPDHREVFCNDVLVSPIQPDATYRVFAENMDFSQISKLIDVLLSNEHTSKKIP